MDEITPERPDPRQRKLAEQRKRANARARAKRAERWAEYDRLNNPNSPDYVGPAGCADRTHG